MSDWRERAACRGVDPSMFFPERGEVVESALAVCEQCPVKGDCLEYALDANEKVGVWGGTTPRERRRIRRQRGQTRRQCSFCYDWFSVFIGDKRIICSETCRKQRRLEVKAESHQRTKDVA